MHRKIKALNGIKRCTSSGCIEDRGGKLIVENMVIIKGWSEYTEELFQDDRRNKPDICKNRWSKDLQSEVKAAINKIKRNKAKSPDDVVIEMVQALGDLELKG